MLMRELTQISYSLIAQSEGGDVGLLGQLGNLPVLAAMLGVIYFLLIRPANKQRDAVAQLRSSLQKGDEIYTSGGIYGKVVSLDEQSVTLEIADKVKIRLLRDHIGGRWGSSAVAKAAAKKSDKAASSKTGSVAESSGAKATS